MASIYKRNKKWRVVIRMQGYPTICKTFDRKEEAQDWAAQQEQKIKKGRFNFTLHNKLSTLNDLIERFKNDGMLEHHKSCKDTQRHLDYWKEKLGAYALVHLSAELIGKERQNLINTPTNKGSKVAKRSPATINRYMSSLSTLLSYGKNLNWIDANPCFNIKKLKEAEGRDRILSIQEASKLLQACKNADHPYLYCIVLIAITSGARKSEILNLKWSDIDLPNKIAYLRKTKNNKPRVIPLVDEAVNELQKLYKVRNMQKPSVFASKTTFGKIDIQKHWQKALNAVNIHNFVFHGLRHVFATFAAQQGASSLELQTATGHRSLELLNRYTHLEADITRKYSENISDIILGEKVNE